MARLFLIYYLLLVLGPIVYIGKFPLASYYFVFSILIFIGFVVQRKKVNNGFLIFFPFYLKCYLFLLTIYLFTYIFNFFEVDYIASIRDFIIIYAPLQYFVLVSITCIVVLSLKYQELQISFIKSIIKLHLYLLMIVGIIAILQMFDLFNMQDVLATYYGNLNVGVWKEYIKYNPRASATFNLEPNTLGLYSSFSLVLFHIFGKDVGLSKAHSILIYFFGFIALIFSGSFTGIIIYFALTTVYFFLYKKLGLKTIVAIFISFLVFTSMFSMEIERSLERQKIGDGNVVPSSLKARIDNAWLTTYLKFENEFFNGIGPSAIQLTHSADNDLLDKFLRFGVIGGVANLIFVTTLVLYPLFVRRKYTNQFERKLLLYSSLIAFAFVLASIPGSAFKAKRIAESFWILYSLPFIYLFIKRKNEA